MDNANQLIVAMAEKCLSVIQESQNRVPGPALPKALHPHHLIWMCEQIREHAEVRPVTKLHRWIGFIQAAMLANGMLELEGLKAMFDQAKGECVVGDGELEDLADHLDSTSAFEFDLGGQG